jgi:CO/xanthine dehydrogenase Mo-binding subunit
MDWGAVDKPDPLNPVGSKGIGEPPVGAGAAALLCALQDALGEDILKRTPVMTDNLLRAIEGMSEPSYTDRSRHT